MNFKPIFLIIFSFFTTITKSDICESNMMELHFGTRIKVMPKIELYYTWCGSSYCYKTRQKPITGSSVETFSEWRRRKECCEGFQEPIPGVRPITCNPICDKPCINASCTSPNICTCLTGYEYLTPNECRPTCVNGCANGICTAPDVCTCNEGYSKALSSTCMPICEINCTNGFCIAPNKCLCSAGYIKDKNSNSICNPVCNQKCVNAKCIAPNNCSCDPNYEQDPVDRYKCNPVCDEHCLNGICASPNNCSCLPNYEPDPVNKNNCNPICENKCINGYCSHPNECTCNIGYIPDETSPKTICKPFCDKGCLNGRCIKPNLCICFEGYQQKEPTLDECVPKMIEEENITRDYDYEDLYNTSLSEKFMNSSLYKDITLNEIKCNSTACYSNEKYKVDNDQCELIPIHLVIIKNCTCHHNIKFILFLNEELFNQEWWYGISYSGTSLPENITLQVEKKTDLSTKVFCHWCLCFPNNDVDASKNLFQFKQCPKPFKLSQIKDRIWPIVIMITIIMVFGIFSLVGYLFWKRHKRIEYDINYKERKNNLEYVEETSSLQLSFNNTFHEIDPTT